MSDGLIISRITGLTISSILIVHGLQGHPYKTWACNPTPKETASAAHSAREPEDRPKDGQSRSIRRIIPRFAEKLSIKGLTRSGEEPPNLPTRTEKCTSIFWPRDLLPEQCPRSRILVYGYDTKVTKYMTNATNKNNVFQHGKDLLYALGRERELNRPLVFVAHSLGGIVVKEMLTRSSAASDEHLKNIVESTSAIIFLGTPHRGSPELAALGEWARSIMGILRMETNQAILAALGLKTTDLERAQESFSSLWNDHDFRVKTFQEGLGLTGIRLGVLGNKVVPDFSSSIGDARERAETLQANHMDMCRFSGKEDPNYRKVAGEIRSIYTSLVDLNTQNIHHGGLIRRRNSHDSPISPAALMAIRKHEPSEAEAACLTSLHFHSSNNRGQRLEKPTIGTCSWLFSEKRYMDWLDNQNQTDSCGLLWIKGKPGSGKSTLVREAYLDALKKQPLSDYCTAAFFFHAKGNDLEHSPIGLSSIPAASDTASPSRTSSKILGAWLGHEWVPLRRT